METKGLIFFTLVWLFCLALNVLGLIMNLVGGSGFIWILMGVAGGTFSFVMFIFTARELYDELYEEFYGNN